MRVERKKRWTVSEGKVTDKGLTENGRERGTTQFTSLVIKRRMGGKGGRHSSRPRLSKGEWEGKGDDTVHVPGYQKENGRDRGTTQFTSPVIKRDLSKRSSQQMRPGLNDSVRA
ncbi:hypothetical protein ACOMHN_024099 [Nucella lapillus]